MFFSKNFSTISKSTKYKSFSKRGFSSIQVKIKDLKLKDWSEVWGKDHIREKIIIRKLLWDFIQTRLFFDKRSCLLLYTDSHTGSVQKEFISFLIEGVKNYPAYESNVLKILKEIFTEYDKFEDWFVIAFFEVHFKELTKGFEMEANSLYVKNLASKSLNLVKDNKSSLFTLENLEEKKLFNL